MANLNKFLPMKYLDGIYHMPYSHLKRNSKTIGIVGSRRRDSTEDYMAIARVFFEIYAPGDTIVSGGCPLGGDRFAEVLAACTGAEMRIHYPDKNQLDPKLMEINPRIAYAKINYARNTLIAQDSFILIATPAPDRKGGTEDTIKKWQKMNPHFKPILV